MRELRGFKSFLGALRRQTVKIIVNVVKWFHGDRWLVGKLRRLMYFCGDWAGLCWCAPCGGCQLKERRGRKKNDWELPPRAARHELGPFPTLPPNPLKKTNLGDQRARTDGRNRPPNCAFWRISGNLRARSAFLPPSSSSVRAHACRRVYKCLKECQKREKKEDKPVERGMVDNSSSSKAQTVSPALRARAAPKRIPGVCSRNFLSPGPPREKSTLIQCERVPVRFSPDLESLVGEVSCHALYLLAAPLPKTHVFFWAPARLEASCCFQSKAAFPLNNY